MKQLERQLKKILNMYNKKKARMKEHRLRVVTPIEIAIHCSVPESMGLIEHLLAFSMDR